MMITVGTYGWNRYDAREGYNDDYEIDYSEKAGELPSLTAIGCASLSRGEHVFRYDSPLVKDALR